MSNGPGAERIAKREEHRPRMQQGLLDVHILALCDPVQELVDVERLGIGLGVQPWHELGGELPQHMTRFPAREAPGQRRPRRLGSAPCCPAAEAPRRPPAYPPDLLVIP